MDRLDRIAEFVTQLIEAYKMDVAYVYLVSKYGVRSSLFIEETIKSGDTTMIEMPLSEAIELRMGDITSDVISFDLNNYSAFSIEVEDLTIDEFKKGMLLYSRDSMNQLLGFYVRRLKFVEEILDLSNYEKEDR